MKRSVLEMNMVMKDKALLASRRSTADLQSLSRSKVFDSLPITAPTGYLSLPHLVAKVDEECLVGILQAPYRCSYGICD